MEVSMLLTADCANLTADGKLNVMGAFNTVFSVAYPVRHHSMSIVVGLRVRAEDVGKIYKITVELTGPDGGTIFSISKGAGVPEDVVGRAWVTYSIYDVRDIVLDKAGKYEFAALIDDNRAYDCEVDAVLVQQGG
jgi:hypothetical protein